MMPETELIKALDQSLTERINNLTVWVKQLQDELYTTRHFVYSHCSHSGAYNNDICGKCELLKHCWPPADYGKDFPSQPAINSCTTRVNNPPRECECIGCAFESQSYDEEPCVEYLGTGRVRCPFRQTVVKT